MVATVASRRPNSRHAGGEDPVQRRTLIHGAWPKKANEPWHPRHAMSAGIARVRRSELTIWFEGGWITVFVGVADVMRAIGCSRSQAYVYLREAAGRTRGQRG